MQMRSIWSAKRFQEAWGNYINDLLYFTLCLFPQRGNHHLVMLTKLLNMHYIHYLAIHPKIGEYPLWILIQFYLRSSLFQDLNTNYWNNFSVSLSRWQNFDPSTKQLNSVLNEIIMCWNLILLIHIRISQVDQNVFYLIDGLYKRLRSVLI